MAKLLTATSLAQFIALSALPLLTRLYDPTAFGELAIFNSITAIIAAFITYGYSSAILRPKSHYVAIHLVATSLISVVINSAIIALIFLSFSGFIFSYINAEYLSSNWWIMPATAFMMGVYFTSRDYLLRKNEFAVLSKVKVKQTLFGTASKVMLGMFGYLNFGLIVGQMFNHISGFLSINKALKNDYNIYYKSIKLKKVLFVAYKYSDFMRYRMPGRIMLLIGSQSPIIIFGIYYSTSLTGQLGLAFSLITFTASILLEAVRKSYFSEISRVGMYNKKKIYHITQKTSMAMFLMVIVPGVIAFLYGDTIFSIVFGSSWAQAGVFAGFLMPMLIARFTFSVTMDAYSVIGKNKLYFIINFVRTIIVLSVFLAFVNLGYSAEVSIAVYSVSIFIGYALGYYILIRLLKKE